MLLKTDFADFVDAVRKARDDFDKHVKMEQAKKAAELARINQRTAPAYIKEESDKVIHHFGKLLQESRENIMNDFDNRFTEFRIKLDASVSVMPDADSINRMAMLSNLPITAKEFTALAKMFGNRNYWTDQSLRQIAEKNGISVDALGVELKPSYDAEVSALDELQAGFTDHITKYNGSDNTPYFVQWEVSDRSLQRIEDSFYQGREPNLSIGQKTKRMLAIVDSADDLAKKSLAVRNMLATADGMERKYLISGLADERFSTVCDTLPPEIKEEIKAFDNKAFREKLVKAADAISSVQKLDLQTKTFESESANNEIIEGFRDTMNDPDVAELVRDRANFDYMVRTALHRSEAVNGSEEK